MYICVCVCRGCPVKCVLIQYFVNLHIQCTTASLPLTEELLFVRKAQAIVDFCLECRSLLKAFKLDISVPEGACCYTLSESVISTYCSFVSLLPYQYAVCIFKSAFHPPPQTTLQVSIPPLLLVPQAGSSLFSTFLQRAPLASQYGATSQRPSSVTS